MDVLDALLDKNTPNFQGRGVLVFISNMDFPGMDQLRETGHKRQQREKEVMNKGWNISNKC
jgi:hypothetical protein